MEHPAKSPRWNHHVRYPRQLIAPICLLVY
jgi:hypothetical protein